jgi:hypothetical protein
MDALVSFAVAERPRYGHRICVFTTVTEGVYEFADDAG